MFVKEGGKTVMMAKKCERKCVCQGGREDSNGEETMEELKMCLHVGGE